MNQHDKKFLKDLAQAVRNGTVDAVQAGIVKRRFRELQSATPLKQKLAAARRNAVAVGFRTYGRVKTGG